VSTAEIAPPTGHAGEHDPHAMPYDPTGSRIGMWLFLFTEILLFGALFIAYGVYLQTYSWQFTMGAKELSIPLGAINTIVLLTSSLSVALSITAVQKGERKLAVRLLDFTLLCAVVFLIIKSFEWGGKFEHGIYPGSAKMLDMTYGEVIYFALYFVMTGLHALHVIIGGALVFWARRRIQKNVITPERFVLLENVGLYWHLVDLVWIYLFPLFYLIH
jgi:cytochrome c oxidase subunit 3